MRCSPIAKACAPILGFERRFSVGADGEIIGVTIVRTVEGELPRFVAEAVDGKSCPILIDLEVLFSGGAALRLRCL
jgi:hypothetical protein